MLALSDEVDFDGEVKMSAFNGFSPVLSPERWWAGAYLSKERFMPSLIPMLSNVLSQRCWNLIIEKTICSESKDHEDVFWRNFHYENTLRYTDDLPQEQTIEVEEEGAVVIGRLLKIVRR